MALRKPLVIVNGVIQQLAAGDTIATGTPIDVGIPYIVTDWHCKGGFCGIPVFD